MSAATPRSQQVWRRPAVRRLWPLAVVLAVTVVAYVPSFRSPLYADDYIYLVATRELSFWEYAKTAFTPWGHEPLLPFTRDYWRPLAFLWFEAAQPVLGDTPEPYHFANLAVHLCSVVLVWVLAARLDPRPAVRTFAAVIFALYPGSFEAVSWISSINSAGLVFALAAWLVFLSATEEDRLRWSGVVLSAALVAVALMFRESGVVLVPAMALWYLLVQRRERLREWRIYLAFVPFAVVAAGYYLVRTRLLSEPFSNAAIYAFDDAYPDRLWYYLQGALLPFRHGPSGWKDVAQDFAGIALLAIPVAALISRRWGLLALALGLLISILPLGATVLGVGLRYFYFSTPLLALLLGIVAAEVLDRLGARVMPVALPAAAAALLLAGAVVTWSRMSHWDDTGPEAQQEWVEGLRAAYPTLPAGGTLYCANVPIILALFDSAMLEPTVRWYYPGIGRAVRVEAGAAPPLGPSDRYYDSFLSARAATSER